MIKGIKTYIHYYEFSFMHSSSSPIILIKLLGRLTSLSPLNRYPSFSYSSRISFHFMKAFFYFIFFCLVSLVAFPLYFFFASLLIYVKLWISFSFQRLLSYNKITEYKNSLFSITILKFKFYGFCFYFLLMFITFNVHFE